MLLEFLTERQDAIVVWINRSGGQAEHKLMAPLGMHAVWVRERLADVCCILSHVVRPFHRLPETIHYFEMPVRIL